MNNYEGEIERMYWTTDELCKMINVSHSTVCTWNHEFNVGGVRGLYTKDMVAKMHVIYNLRRVELYSVKGVKLQLQKLKL